MGVERVGRETEKLLLRCRLLGRLRGRRGAGHIAAAARLQLVLLVKHLSVLKRLHNFVVTESQ